MIATVFATRIDGPGANHLSLHTSHEGAVSALLTEGGRLYKARFDYVPPELSPVTAAVLAEFSPAANAARTVAAEDRLTGGGWNGRVEELPVELSE